MANVQHPAQSNWRRPIPGEDPAIARLTAMVAALTSELTVVRERLDTVERLAEAAGVLTQAQVEGYEPDAAAASARDRLRKRQIEKVFKPLRDDAEAAARHSHRSAGAKETAR
jgi:hypothetical protein